MNELRQKVRKIKLELNLSDRELSKRLGKSPTYLSKIFEVGISTARQKALSDELDKVAKGELFISKEEYIKILLRDAEYNRNCMKQYMNKVNDLRRELNEAKSKYQALNNQAIGDMLDKNSEIEKLQADFNEYLGKYDECFTQLSQQKEENIDLKIEKESILSVLGPEIKNLKSMLDKVDTVNDELREELGLKNRNALIQKFKLKKLTNWNYFLCAVIIVLIVLLWGV